MCCLSRIEETEGRKTDIILFLKEKAKGTKYERLKGILLFAKYYSKMQHCLLEVTEVASESKIFKIGETFRATYDWLILFSS